MAKAKRNLKTHPDADLDDKDSPERTDLRPEAVPGDEVIDVFGKEQQLDKDTDRAEVSPEDSHAADSDTQESEAAHKPERAVREDVEDRREPARGDRDYSSAVRKRIARERAATNRERALREQTQSQLAEERAARQKQDERLARLERAQTEITGNADVKALEAKIASLVPQIAAATEAGNTAEALRLQIAPGDAQGDLKVLKYDLKRQNEEAARKALDEPAKPAETAQVVVGREESAEWIDQNKHWWNRPKYNQVKEDTKLADAALLKEVRDGDHDFEPYSDEYFQEIANRVHEAHPDVELVDRDGMPYEFDTDSEDDDTVNDQNRRNGGNGRRQSNAPVRGRPPMGQGGQGGRRAPTEHDLAKQGKYVLGEEDFRTMRTFKLDPHDPNAKKAFAKERIRTILTNGPGERS